MTQNKRLFILLILTSNITSSLTVTWLPSLKVLSANCTNVIVTAKCPVINTRRNIEFFFYKRGLDNRLEENKLVSRRCARSPNWSVQTELEVQPGSIYSAKVSMSPDGYNCDELCQFGSEMVTFTIQYNPQLKECESRQIIDLHTTLSDAQTTPMLKNGLPFLYLTLLTCVLTIISFISVMGLGYVCILVYTNRIRYVVTNNNGDDSSKSDLVF